MSNNEPKIEWTVVPQEWTATHGRWELFVRPSARAADGKEYLWMVSREDCAACANSKEASPEEAMAKAADAAIRLSRAFD
jgi:hypothetical protein